MTSPGHNDLGVPRRFWVACIGALLIGSGLRVAVDAVAVDTSRSTDTADEIAAAVEAPARSRSAASYRGLGVWIDAFDFDPAYQTPGGTPSVRPDAVDAFADLGVRTIYIQAARRDDRSGPGLLDEAVLADFLVRAHTAGMHVVAWYLPRFDSVEADLAKTLAMADFEVEGHRFDGIALDIEDNVVVPDHDQRSDALVELVDAVRAERPDDALGAIVPPAVQMEVINPGFWPDFPWKELADDFAVWMPMAYWTTRSADSGYRDAYRYTTDSVDRMISALGRDVHVHLVGGIGDQTTPEDLADFREALERTGAVGGSIYDWNSLSDDLRQRLPETVP